MNAAGKISRREIPMGAATGAASRHRAGRGLPWRCRQPGSPPAGAAESCGQGIPRSLCASLVSGRARPSWGFC